MIRAALVVSIFVSTASLARGYWIAGYHDAARAIVVCGVVWFVSHWRKWRWFPAPAILCCLLLAAFGVWFGFHYGWMFSGAAFALIAYDLGEFQSQIKALPIREDIPGRARRRILRISVSTGLGLALATLLMLYRGQFTRDWGLFLIVVALIVCAQIFAWLKR
ncbi:MAG: hypothetical protein DCC59_02110 [Chloroflexi bacterium]|nr:hypothetical protein [Anaerolineales bacterium]RIK55049.1 MAG: hypothetical protein DCC59_02110 [Chloroflexota bacterium]